MLHVNSRMNIHTRYPSIKATEAPVSSDDKANKLKTVVAALDDLQNTVTVQTLNMETHIFSNK